MARGHEEGAKSAKDTITGGLASAAAGVAYVVLAKPWLAKQGIKLTGEQEASVGVAMTLSLTSISSYIHGFLRGMK